MQNRVEPSKKTRLFLQLLCVILSLALAFGMLSACKKTDSGAVSSDASQVEQNGEEGSDESDPPDTDDGDLDDGDLEDGSSDDDYEIITDGDATDDDDETDPSAGLDLTDAVQLSVYNAKAPVNDNYMGMNATVWHAYGFMDNGEHTYTDEMLDVEMDRLEQMGIQNCRTMFQLNWAWDSNRFNFNKQRVQDVADYCIALDKRDMSVMLNQMWYTTAFGNASNSGVTGYINGFGNDIYAESTTYADCVAKEWKKTGDMSPSKAGMGAESTTFKEATVTEYFDRLAVSALRYGSYLSELIKNLKAKGANNIDYLLYFTEPSYYYMTPDDPKGPYEQEYLFYCRTIRNVLEKTGMAKGIKHVGPNQGHIAVEGALLNYVMERDPDLFDIASAHFYPSSNDATGDTYYDYCYEAITTYQNDMENANISWGEKEFWMDEFKAHQEGASKNQGQIAALGTQTVIGNICAQQMGVDNVLLWQAFDQAWVDTRETSTEFTNGIHMCGLAPSLAISATPYQTYYTVGLFTRYNNSKEGGKAIATSSGDYVDYPGVYIGATELPDGNITITVASVNVADTTFVINFDKALGKNLHRHVEDTLNRVPKNSARLADPDCTFKKVGTTLADTIAPFAVQVYTTCEY